MDTWNEHAVMIGHSSSREDWLETRGSGIGASEVASVLGVGFLAPAELWAQKTGQIPADDLSEVERIEWGNRLESVVAHAYAEPRYAGRPVKMSGQLLRSTVYPWAIATLDAVTLHPEHGWVPLEIKTASAFLASEWQDGPPEPYYLQVQAQMLVTGARWASVACLIGGNQLVWCDIERDETAIARIVAGCSRMWAYIVECTMPPPDNTPEWARVFATLNPESADASVVDLDESDLELAAELEAAKAARKAAEERETLAKNRLIERIGNASEARFRDGTGFTYRTQHRAGHTVAPSTFRVLRESAAPKKTKRKAA